MSYCRFFNCDCYMYEDVSGVFMCVLCSFNNIKKKNIKWRNWSSNFRPWAILHVIKHTLHGHALPTGYIIKRLLQEIKEEGFFVKPYKSETNNE